MTAKVLFRSAALAATLLVLSGCAASANTSTAAGSQNTAPAELRLGYFPNFTHAPAIVGIDQGFYEDELGSDTELAGKTFNAGPEALEALLSGSIDAAFIGPSPTVTGYTQSNGEALQVVAGAAANGAFLIVNDEIQDVADLEGKTLATPQLGNTQDVALRYWLQEEGYETTTEGGGDVSIQPQSNSTALQAFVQGEIDGAWVPEPYATQMIALGNGHVLVDESTIWPDNKFVVTNLVVSKEYLAKYPDAVDGLLKGLLTTLDFMADNPDEAKTVVNDSLKALTGSSMPAEDLDKAWENVIFTYDPIASSLVTGAAHAKSLGLLQNDNLDGLFNLKPLNALLEDAGLEKVSGP